jgi:hypothetical protein
MSHSGCLQDEALDIASKKVGSTPAASTTFASKSDLKDNFSYA